jgi:diacylglycerol kinase
MVCCTIIAALLGLIFRPFVVRRASPLGWRLAVVENRPIVSGSSYRHSRLQSFRYAFAGLKFVTRNEPNMRIHIIAGITAVMSGLWLRLNAADWRWLILAVGLVLAAEAMNTAVEQACNAISRIHNPAIKAAKDVAAGAVLITAIAAALIGVSVFAPHIPSSIVGNHVAVSSYTCGGL